MPTHTVQDPIKQLFDTDLEKDIIDVEVKKDEGGADEEDEKEQEEETGTYENILENDNTMTGPGVVEGEKFVKIDDREEQEIVEEDIYQVYDNEDTETEEIGDKVDEYPSDTDSQPKWS